MQLYLLIIFILASVMLAYIGIARFLGIVDKPNKRSSHQYNPIRGGGIIFPVAALLWFLLYGFNAPWIITALILISFVSFIDDLIQLSSSVRFLGQISATTVLFWQLQLFGFPWYSIVLFYIITIGWINAFNFMDGINGITGIYGLVTLITFAWLNQSVQFISLPLLVVLIFSTLIFLFFNLRKQAKAFAGDVGSISLAFLLSWFLISLILKTGQIEYILFFAVYGIDSVITILLRIIRRENIFKAHRTHLYQFLSNEYKWSHVSVSLIYGLIQSITNIIVILIIQKGLMSWYIFLLSLLILSIIYIITRYRIQKAIQFKYSF